MFDEGCFKDDKEEAARRVASLMRVMESENNDQAISSSAGDSLLMVFELVWRRVAEVRDIRRKNDRY